MVDQRAVRSSAGGARAHVITAARLRRNLRGVGAPSHSDTNRSHPVVLLLRVVLHGWAIGWPEKMSNKLTEPRVVSCVMHAAWKEKFLGVVAKAIMLAKDESKRSGGKADVREAFSRLIKLHAEVCGISCTSPSVRCSS